jgi:hypothetical protein
MDHQVLPALSLSRTHREPGSKRLQATYKVKYLYFSQKNIILRRVRFEMLCVLLWRVSVFNAGLCNRERTLQVVRQTIGNCNAAWPNRGHGCG